MHPDEVWSCLFRRLSILTPQQVDILSRGSYTTNLAYMGSKKDVYGPALPTTKSTVDGKGVVEEERDVSVRKRNIRRS